MRKYFFSLFAAMLFLAGNVSGAALKLVPESAVYVLSFDLDRIAALPAVKEAFKEKENNIHGAFKAAGCSRIVLAGGVKWGVALADFSCKEDALLALLDANGIKAEKVLIDGRNFYKLDHYQLGNLPAIQKPVLTFIAPDTVAIMEQQQIGTVLAALKKVRNVSAGKEIMWGSVEPKRFSVPDFPQVRDVAKMFRKCTALTLKIDMTGEKQDHLFIEAVAVCPNEDTANFIAFVLPTGMIMAMNYLCASDAELCNQLPGMLVPGISGRNASVRLTLSPDQALRVSKAIEATGRSQFENFKGNSF